MKRSFSGGFLFLGALWTLSLIGASNLAGQQPSRGVLDDWEVLPGFALEVDTDGYQFPTSIAFVPSPGPRPGDPLYFVTELGGTVKVITNDRTVHTFVAGLTKIMRAKGSHSAHMLVEQGVAGLCLDPARGYVFVSFAYQDTGGVTRNNMIRFETKPGTFATQPVRHEAFTQIFARDVAADSHQIGGCVVKDDQVYVGVGDAGTPDRSRNRSSTLGKILRMDVDGRPARGNPFVTRERAGAEDYVWAFGLRNPFSIRQVGDRLFAMDNGTNIDRFVELESGRDYLWDGTDRSIGAAALAVIAPAIAPVQFDHLERGTGLFPRVFEDRFYVASSGDLRRHGPGAVGEKSVVMLNFDRVAGRMRDAPAAFLRYRGKGQQGVVGLGIGPDGLYFVALMPASDGRSAVIKVRYDPAREHSFVIGKTLQAATLMADKGCLGCHLLDQQGGDEGPALDQPDLSRRLLTRLRSDEYAAMVAALDTVTDPLIARWAPARRDVLEAEDQDKVRKWLRYRLLDPRFDSPDARMPDPGLSEKQADLIVAHLLEPPPKVLRSMRNRLVGSMPEPRHRHTLLALIAGVLLLYVSQVTWRHIRRRRDDRLR